MVECCFDHGLLRRPAQSRRQNRIQDLAQDKQVRTANQHARQPLKTMPPSFSPPLHVASYAAASSSAVKVASVSSKGKRKAQLALAVDGEGLWRYDVRCSSSRSWKSDDRLTERCA